MSLDMRQQDIGERRHTRFCTEEGMNPRNLANISLLTAGSDLGGPNDDEELWSLDATKLIRLAGVLRVEINRLQRLVCYLLHRNEQLRSQDLNERLV